MTDRGKTVLVLAVAAAMTACGKGSDLANPAAPSPPPVVGRTNPAPPPVSTMTPETFVGAGDIGMCGLTGAEETARLLDAIPGTVFTAGDHAYPLGSAKDFRTCYDPTWGRHRGRTRPTPGNHDYDTVNAADYFAYFGANAGDGRGYYSYMIGDWLILSLNSNVPSQDGSAQYEWVKSEIVRHPSRCALAYWHHPVISSGPNGSNALMQPLWRLMVRSGVDVVIAGHDHIYERYAPMDERFGFDPSGTRQFIAGTGGAGPYAIVAPQPGSEVRGSRWGVLKMTLRGDGYDWEFIGVPSSGFSDRGSDRCH